MGELKKLRRSAGTVRDLDVHIEMLEEFAAPAAASGHSRTKTDALRDGAATLLKSQQKRRDQAAARLQKLLQKREADLATALEALLHALKPAAGLTIPATQLFEIMERAEQRAYGEQVDPAKRKRRLSDEQLHRLRKRAKLARYLAESAPGSARAKQLAKRSEALQDTGGRWHDLLDLAEQARDKLGRHHALTVELEARCGRRRAGFLVARERAA
jgi:CHAD domain-containing protein